MPLAFVGVKSGAGVPSGSPEDLRRGREDERGGGIARIYKRRVNTVGLPDEPIRLPFLLSRIVHASFSKKSRFTLGDLSQPFDGLTSPDRFRFDSHARRCASRNVTYPRTRSRRPGKNRGGQAERKALAARQPSARCEASQSRPGTHASTCIMGVYNTRAWKTMDALCR